MVSKKQCEQIMKLPISCNIWTRLRAADHSGAVRRKSDLGEFFVSNGAEEVSSNWVGPCYRCNKSYEVEVSSLLVRIRLHTFLYLVRGS